MKDILIRGGRRFDLPEINIKNTLCPRCGNDWASVILPVYRIYYMPWDDVFECTILEENDTMGAFRLFCEICEHEWPAEYKNNFPRTRNPKKCRHMWE